MDNEVELLKARIEALERDPRRAISISSEAMQEEFTAKAYKRGFRDGFDRAFSKEKPRHGDPSRMRPGASSKIRQVQRHQPPGRSRARPYLGNCG